MMKQNKIRRKPHHTIAIISAVRFFMLYRRICVPNLARSMAILESSRKAATLCYFWQLHTTHNAATSRQCVEQKIKNHIKIEIHWWSPTQLLIYQFDAYAWQSKQDARFFSICGGLFG